MRIAFDIDGVLTDLLNFHINYISKYCVLNNISYNIDNSFCHYSAAKLFNISERIEDDFWDEYLEVYAKNCNIRPLASEVLKKLKDDGCEIFIITARRGTNRDDEVGENMRNIVKEWLEKNDVIYDKLIFSKASRERKVDEIRKYKIDLIVEDNPNNINELSKLIPVICYNAGYNKNCCGKNIFRCYSFYDIYRLIKEEFYGK